MLSITSGKAKLDRKTGFEEGAHCYFDYLPEIIEAMAAKGVSAETTREAWITMYFKALCWGAMHSMYQSEQNPDEPLNLLPAEYWGSPFLVRIGKLKGFSLRHAVHCSVLNSWVIGSVSEGSSGKRCWQSGEVEHFVT